MALCGCNTQLKCLSPKYVTQDILITPDLMTMAGLKETHLKVSTTSIDFGKLLKNQVTFSRVEILLWVNKMLREN